MNILDAINDPQVFGQHFRRPESWAAWRTILATLFGLQFDEGQRRLFQQCTGRERPAPDGYTEAWLVIGRRGGKSFVLALIAVFLACFRDWRPYLGPGERGTIMVVAADRKQARAIMRYVKGLMSAAPMLARTIEGKTRESVNLRHRVTIEVHTASFRSTRGYTIVAALLDEIAFWPTDESAAEPDVEIINAIKPGMATIPGAMLLCASSPYARKGALWEAYRKHHGRDGRVLVWQAATRTMNPSLPQRVVDEAVAKDPAWAQAEYGAEFRSDIESYITRESVEACVAVGTLERPPQPGTPYQAFCDPSGGIGDSFTLAIGHRHGDIAVVDALREVKPPFSPETVVDELARTVKSYGVTKVVGDRYAGAWPGEQFLKRGVAYEVTKKFKNDLYRDLLPMVNSQRVDLPDSARLITQLVSLERRTARGGRDSIDHPPGQHDDLANAVAGIVDGLLLPASTYDATFNWVDGPADGKSVDELNAEWRQARFNAFIMNGGRLRL